MDYPPGSMIVLWAEGKLYEAIDPAMPSDRRFNAVINLGPLLGSLAILALLWRSAPGETGRSRGLVFWLNPAVLLAAPVLGYQDPVFGAFAVAAVIALMQRRYVLASALVAAAGLVKPQGILLVPVFLAVVLREAKPATWVRSCPRGPRRGRAGVPALVEPGLPALRSRGRVPAAGGVAPLRPGPEPVVDRGLRDEMGAGGSLAHF